MQLQKCSIFLMLLILLLAGCTSKDVAESSGGIVSYMSSTSLGGKDGNGDITAFTYSLYITNENSNSYIINSIEPILVDEIMAKVIDVEIIKKVNKKINPKETLEVVGEIQIETKGMTKEEIVELTDLISDYKIALETVIETQKSD